MAWKWRRKDADPAAMEQALPGIGAIDWASLRSGTFGPADQVPQLLTALATVPEETDRSAIRAGLSENLAVPRFRAQAVQEAGEYLLDVRSGGREPLPGNQDEDPA